METIKTEKLLLESKCETLKQCFENEKANVEFYRNDRNLLLKMDSKSGEVYKSYHNLLSKNKEARKESTSRGRK